MEVKISKNELYDKINQLHNTVKDNNEVSDKTDYLQMEINNLKVSMCALEKNLLPSYRA